MRHPFRNIARMIGAVFIGLAVLAGSTAASYASEGNNIIPVEDLNGELASLTVSLVYEDEERQEEIPIEGAVIDLYKVADLTVSNGTAHYVLTKDFEASGISFEWMTASQSLKAARELDQLIEEKGISPTKTGVVDDKGIAAFAELDPGMYLGRQRDLVQISDGVKTTMEPVLWMTPMYELSAAGDRYQWNYHPEVLPKEGEIDITPTETPPTGTPPTGTPPTGTPSTGTPPTGTPPTGTPLTGTPSVTGTPPTGTPLTGTPSVTGMPPTTGTPSVSKKPTVTQKPTTTGTPPTTTPRTPSSSSGGSSSSRGSSGGSTSSGGTSRSSTTTTTAVKTGDASPVELYMVTAAAALVLIIWMMKKKA